MSSALNNDLYAIQLNVRESVAEQLCAIREDSGKTLEDIYHETGLAVPALSRTFSGSHNPTLNTLALICHSLGVEVKIG